MIGLKRAYLKRKAEILSKNSSEKTRYAYAMLAANIYTQMDKENVKCISVVGVNSYDGGGETALSLAVQMAFDKRRVLYIDCHFGCPNLSRMIPRESQSGGELIIRRCETKGIDVVYAEDLSDDSSSAEISRLLKNAREKYDAVILDLESILESAAAVTYAKLTDGMLFVVNRLTTKKKEFENTLATIGHADIRVLGSVFVSVS